MPSNLVRAWEYLHRACTHMAQISDRTLQMLLLALSRFSALWLIDNVQRKAMAS